MKLRHPRLAAARPRVLGIAAGAALLSVGLCLPLVAASAATPVLLGTTEGFAVLAGETITNTGSTTIAGDIGLHPGTEVTGSGPGADRITQAGARYIADDEGVALQAKNDLVTAYDDAAGQSPVTRIATELGGATLTAGAYDSAAGTFGVTDTLTLDAEGDPDAVFVFQMATTLTTASTSTVALVDGAQACNVFWQVGSSATLGTNSSFLGTILALTDVHLTTGAVVEGRVLARNGEVTMDTNTIAVPTCVDGEDTTDGGDVTDGGEATDGDTGEGGDVTDGGGATDGDTAEGGDVTDGGGATDGDADGGTTEDGNSTGGGDATDGGTTTTSGGETTGQVVDVPRGGVAAGDGSRPPAWRADLALLAYALTLVVAGHRSWLAARRRAQA